MLITFADGDETEGAAPSKDTAPRNTSGPEGPKNGNTASGASQPKTPSALAAKVRATLYPAPPVDVAAALQRRIEFTEEANLDSLAAVLFRRGKYSAVLFNAKALEAVKRWAAAELLYYLVAEPDPAEGESAARYSPAAPLGDAAAFAAELLLPAEDFRGAWAHETQIGHDAGTAGRTLAAIFDVPEAHVFARAVELDLIDAD